MDGTNLGGRIFAVESLHGKAMVQQRFLLFGAILKKGNDFF
jgi:hypothetical protein